MNLTEAVDKGVRRVRKAKWPVGAYLLIDLSSDIWYYFQKPDALGIKINSSAVNMHKDQWEPC
jgi:hypothetical protein